jgi:hypothetical protein
MSTDATLNNQLFGCASWSGETLRDSIKVPGIEPLTACRNGHSGQWRLELLCTSKTVILSGSAPEQGAYAYVWGTVAHPEISISQIPAWAAQIVASGRYERLRELLGYFVIIVEEPAKRRVSLVSDILGVRPLFYRLEKNRLIFGSDAWMLRQAGLTSGEIDWDAVSSWIVYGCNFTDRPVFADLQRVEAGSVLIFDEDSQRVIPYVRFPVSDQMLPQQEAAEQVHAILQPVCKAIFSQYPKVNVALSGGYDSRYLLALALEANATIDKVITVSFTKEEGETAARVASTLGVQLETLPVEKSEWDLYDSVYHFTPDGFPISKFVTHCLAERYPGIPMLNGYLGGPLLRGYEFKGFSQPNGRVDWPSLLMEKNWFLSAGYLVRWMGDEMTRRILRRARNPMAMAVEKGSYTNNLVSWVDLYYAQARYYANNMIQHLHLTEALLPLYNYDLLAFKFGHHPNVLSREVHLDILRTYYPKLAVMPHANDLYVANVARKKSTFLSRLAYRPTVSAHTAKWARQLAVAMLNPDNLRILQKSRAVPFTLASTSSFLQWLSHRVAEGAEATAFQFERFYLFESRCRDEGVDLDWQSI